MKKLLFALASLVLSVACTAEKNGAEDNHSGNSGNEKDKIAPSVTVGPNHISAVSVVLNGKVWLEGASGIVEYGFAYSASAAGLVSNPIIIKSENVDSDSNYSSPVSGLMPETTYYYRSYLYKDGNNHYGETKSFTTKELSSLLTTQDATEVEATKANLNAKLDLSEVKYGSIEYGFLWGRTESEQSNSLKGGYFADNAFAATMNNLSQKTQYWYKAYVKLDSQTFYGEVKTFTTSVASVGSVSLDKTEYTFHTLGSGIYLKASVLPASAPDKRVEWTSSNPNIASVEQFDMTGGVTAVGNGKATITVTTKDQGKTATCEITVAQWVTSFTLDKTLFALAIGGKNTLSVTSILPDNAYDTSYTWSSSDSAIASVDNSGKVTAKSKGTATIKATANDGSGVFASCSVVVFDIPQAVDMGTVVNGKNIKWASFNIGASSPEEYGCYYAWGETEPHPKDKYGQYDYFWKNYKFRISGDKYDNVILSKYNTNSKYGNVDNKTELELEDDVAHIKLGGKWRMPTIEEWKALGDLEVKEITRNGINGYLVTASNGNSIFLPCSAYRDLYGNVSGEKGYYWSSSLYTGYPLEAWLAFFEYRDYNTFYINRCNGCTVRPVWVE